MKTMKVDLVASGHLLDSFADAFMDWLKAFTMPTLVVCGSEDDDNGSAAELADALPGMKRQHPTPGSHADAAVAASGTGLEHTGFVALVK